MSDSSRPFTLSFDSERDFFSTFHHIGKHLKLTFFNDNTSGFLVLAWGPDVSASVKKVGYRLIFFCKQFLFHIVIIQLHKGQKLKGVIQ
jgi:hypothetical protein